jgi:hypothetical protein
VIYSNAFCIIHCSAYFACRQKHELLFFHMHQRREVCSDMIFVGWRCTRDRNALQTFSTGALLQQSVYKWITICRNACTSVTDEKQSGHLSTSTTEGNIEQVRAMILYDQWVTISEAVHHLHISCGSAHESSKAGLDFIKSVHDRFQNNSQESTSATIC